MDQRSADTYQVAGFDACERGFSRPVEFEPDQAARVRAVFRYERIRVVTDPCSTPEEALRSLIQSLQAEGYRQLRGQRSFREGVYLGSQEGWIEFPDPPASRHDGWWARVTQWFRAWTCGRQHHGTDPS
jgi:hypothetical protein